MLVSTIDTRYGTYNSHNFSNGNTLPLTGVPFGMNYFTLQTTDTNGSWFFNPYEPVYQGIRLTHQPSPWISDFSTVLITPVCHALQHSDLFHRQSSYALNTAIFRPDLLSLFSKRYAMQIDLVPSMYGAMMQLKARHANETGFVLHAPGYSTITQLDDYHLAMRVDNATQTQCSSFSMYLVFQCDKPITYLTQLENDNTLPTKACQGDNLHVRVDCQSDELSVKLATSFIGFEQANYHLSQLQDFDTQQELATNAWDTLLNRIRIQDQSADTRLFYHCLYRCLLFPQTFHEITPDNKIVHFDTTSGNVKDGKFFTNNGYWDTFRTTYPLYSLLYPDFYGDFLEGILSHYKDTGFLPKWLSPDERGMMPGTLVDGVIADACTKGIRPDLMPDLLEAMIQTSQKEDPNKLYGRHGSSLYQQLGYLPYSFNESVSHSLDYAYSDWCIAQVAKTLGHQVDSKRYLDASLQYKQLFDSTVGFMRAKDEAGAFRSDFSVYSWGKDYAECSAIQATLSVFHDIEGLIDLMGGKNAFTNYLIRLCNDEPLFQTNNYQFEIHEMSEMAQSTFGQLALSNQPSFHIPYLFQWSCHKEYTSLLIKHLLKHAFSDGFKAFPGDEDNGSLSAWYIFSSLGFYPVCPGKATYQLGIPQFEHVTLFLPSTQKTLHIQTNHLYDHYLFTNHAQLDNQPVKELTHEQLLAANKLTFTLGLLPVSSK